MKCPDGATMTSTLEIQSEAKICLIYTARDWREEHELMRESKREYGLIGRF